MKIEDFQNLIGEKITSIAGGEYMIVDVDYKSKRILIYNYLTQMVLRYFTEEMLLHFRKLDNTKFEKEVK